MLFSNAVPIRRLPNGWAAIHSQTRFFSQLFFMLQSVHSFPPASCIQLAYTLHFHPDKPQSLEYYPPMLNNGFFKKRGLGYGELGYALFRRELWLFENVSSVPFTAVACGFPKFMEQHQTESLMEIDSVERADQNR